MFSAIICYYRPFSPNERVANVKAKSQLKLEEFSRLLKNSANELVKKAFLCYCIAHI